jgi:hypothetical protein
VAGDDGAGLDEAGASSGGGIHGAPMAFDDRDGATADNFDVTIERDQSQVSTVALACGGCADIEAVASGGNPPYSFVWEDGSTGPSRRVCPKSTTTYEVTVTDTAVTSGEFPRPPRTGRATLTATASCAPDAGSGLCIVNPSLEGKAAIYEFGGFTAPPWKVCDLPGTPDIRSASVGWTVPGPDPSQGATYLEILWLAQVWRETVGAPLCAPLVAGRSYSFKIDATYYQGTVEGVPPGRLQVRMANDLCAEEDQLVWTSPSLGLSWHTYCVTFTAMADYKYIKLEPADQETGVLVDNIVPVASCSP